MSKLIVIGGTGQQGGSVLDTFLNLPDWKVRTVNRDPAKQACKDLEAKGVEVVKGDLDDVDSLTTAVQGANLVFGVTDFWGLYFSMAKDNAGETKSLPEVVYDREVQQGKNLVKAISTITDTTLENFVWSTLSAAKERSNGKYSSIYHFDSKAAVTDHIRSEYPALAKKTSFLQMGFYAENMAHLSGIPGATVPYVHTRGDTGKFVKGLWEAGPGKTLVGVSESITQEAYMKLWSEHNGVDARWDSPSLESIMQHLGESLGREMWESNMYTTEFGWAGGEKGVVYPAELGIETTAMKDFVKAQDWSKAIETAKQPFLSLFTNQQ